MSKSNISQSAPRVKISRKSLFFQPFPFDFPIHSPYDWVQHHPKRTLSALMPPLYDYVSLVQNKTAHLLHGTNEMTMGAALAAPIVQIFPSSP